MLVRNLPLAQRIEQNDVIVNAHLDRLDFLNGQHGDGCITCDEANLYAIVILDDMRRSGIRRTYAL